MQDEAEAPGPQVPPADQSWASTLFPDQVPESSMYPQFYLGEDEEEKYEWIDALFHSHLDLDDAPPKYGPRLELSKEKYTSLFRQWRGSLIIKLLGKSVSFRTLDQRLRDLWTLEHGFELTDFEGDFYIARFYCRSDYLMVLEGGPWVILGHYLTVMKWRPKFRPSAATISSTLVWVRFPGIYPEMLDEETLSSLGDLIGTTVKVDSTSLTGLRGRFSRVCVEVNLGAPLIPSVTVFDEAQKVEYEDLHLICFKCGCYGHWGEQCPSLMPPPDPNPNPPSDTHPVDASAPPSPPHCPEPPSIYGPWMLSGFQRHKQFTHRHRPALPAPGTRKSSVSSTALAEVSEGQLSPAHERLVAQPQQSAAPTAEALVAQTGSRFTVLAALQEEGPGPSHIAKLKEHIQALPSPSTRRPGGSAHQRPPGKGKAPAHDESSRGRIKEPGPKAKAPFRKPKTASGLVGGAHSSHQTHQQYLVIPQHVAIPNSSVSSSQLSGPPAIMEVDAPPPQRVFNVYSK